MIFFKLFFQCSLSRDWLLTLCSHIITECCGQRDKQRTYPSGHQEHSSSVYNSDFTHYLLLLSLLLEITPIKLSQQNARFTCLEIFLLNLLTPKQLATPGNTKVASGLLLVHNSCYPIKVLV